MRKVYTNLPATQINNAIISSVLGQMSDGIWENSSRMERIWRGLSYENEDGKIVITVDRPSELMGYDDEYIRQYMANKIKQVVKVEIDDGLRTEWDRSSRAVSRYLSRYSVEVQVRDAYTAYDTLKSRTLKNPAPEVSTIADLELGQRCEEYGKLTFKQDIDIEGVKYVVIKGTRSESPLVVSPGKQVRVITN